MTGDIFIFGDNATNGAVVEDETGFNANDGDDIIDVGNDNMNVRAYGQGGNDKLIGGFGAM